MEVHVQELAGKAYAGVGSRSTPVKILQWMELIGRAMAEAGMVLRSGAAAGAGSAHRAATVTKCGRSDWIRPPRPNTEFLTLP